MTNRRPASRPTIKKGNPTMSLDLYLTTSEPELVKIYDDVIAAHSAWADDVIALCKTLGFDYAKAHDFSAPYEFVKERPDDFPPEHRFKGPAIEGYNCGDYDSRSGGWVYRFRKKHQQTKARQEMCAAIKAKHWPSGKHPNAYLTAKGMIVDQLGMYAESFRSVGSKMCIRFSSVYKLQGSLLVDMPISQDKESNRYVLPEIPQGWTEITTRQVAELFNAANDAAAAANT